MIKVIPQKIIANMESIEDAHGKIVRPSINMDIDINALDFDKKLIKKYLGSLFTEVLEYFD